MLPSRVHYLYPTVIDDAITLVSHTALHVQLYQCMRERRSWRPVFFARRPSGACERSRRGTRMSAFDYNAEAELFPSRAVRRQPVGYKRFARAADAIRFAIEELPAQSLAGAWLEVDEERFDATQILRLYEHADYPLQRSPRAPSSSHLPTSKVTGRRRP